MKKYIVTVNGVKYEVVVENADPNATYTPAAAPAAAPAKKAEVVNGVRMLYVDDVSIG